MKCAASSDCPHTALPLSNYCAAHHPAPPVPPAPRIVHDGAAPPLRWILLGVAALFVAMIAIGIFVKPGVQTSALGKCPLEVKFEQLHVVVTRRGDRLEVECMYLGSRGTYGIKR